VTGRRRRRRRRRRRGREAEGRKPRDLPDIN